MRLFSKKAVITAGTILAATASCLFAEQASSSVFVIDRDGHALDASSNGAYLGSNVLSITGPVVYRATAPGAPLVVEAPAFCIKSVNGEGRIFINRTFQEPWQQCWGYNDAVDISSRGDIAYAVTAGGQIVKSVNGSEFSTANVAQLRDGQYGRVVSPKRIDIDGAGNPWVVASDNCLYKLVNGAYEIVDLRADQNDPTSVLTVKDVGAGSGLVSVIADVAMTGGAGKLFHVNAENGDVVASNTNFEFKLRAVDVNSFGKVYVVEDHKWAKVLTGSTSENVAFEEAFPSQRIQGYDVGVQ
ncbi:MAG: hypothetical protein GY795_04995 [Desulfobacterales bacterium]|nr:hypothetical protein [Desulfobacterales bacterium]